MLLRFIRAIPRTPDISTFVFEPLPPTQWVAGQSIKIEMQGAYGPLEHRFTISTPPYAKKIAITTRNSGSAYKKRLFSLQPGAEVRAYAIEGGFIWQESDLPKIWVAAGIGITPFYAMLQDRTHKKLPLDATLFYRSREAIFKRELDTLAANHPEFILRNVDSRITATDILAEHKAKQRLIYLSGPSIMVDQLSEELLNSGVSESHLIRDWFTGRLDPED